MTTRIHTVRELVVALQGEDQDALVVATWEGILRAITVYHARSSWTRTAGTTDPTSRTTPTCRAMRGVVDLAFLIIGLAILAYWCVLVWQAVERWRSRARALEVVRRWRSRTEE